MAGHQYGDMLCTDHSERHSELDNDEEDEEDEEEDDDEDEEEAEDDDFYDEEDSNIDEDFEGLSINEEREIMRYALASHDLQQYENQLRAQQQHQNQHHGQQQYSCSSDTDNGCADNNTNSNSYDLGTCHNHHNSSNNSSGHSNASDSNPNLSIYNSTEKLIMDTSLFDTKMRLIGNGIVLLVSTFALLVLLPLYFQQMTTNGPRFNVFGATFLLSAAAALVFLVVTIALGVAIKWKVPFYKPPLPWTK